MTCHVGENIVVCDGISGWRVEPAVYCPWCLETRRGLGTLIFSGWCGSDYICGTCGSKWSSEGYDLRRMGRMSNEEREKNIARVAAKADPRCWACHDTGDKGGGPLDDEPIPCDCASGKEK